jgi:hypothetical protein
MIPNGVLAMFALIMSQSIGLDSFGVMRPIFPVPCRLIPDLFPVQVLIRVAMRAWHP